MKDKFIEFAKTPLGTAICIGVFVLAIVIYIFTNTSIGRKALKGLRIEFTNLKEESKKKAEQVEESVEKHKEETKEELKKQVESLKNDIALIKTYLELIGKTINNKKVKEIIAKLESEKLGNEKEE